MKKLLIKNCLLRGLRVSNSSHDRKVRKSVPRVLSSLHRSLHSTASMQSVEAGWARSSDTSSDDLSLSHSLDVHVHLTPRPARRLRGCRSRRELHKCLVGSARGTVGVIITPTGLYEAARDGSMRDASRMGSGRVVRASCMLVSRVESIGVGTSLAA